MVIPVNEKKFLKYTEAYILEILKLSKNFNSKKNKFLNREVIFEPNIINNILWK